MTDTQDSLKDSWGRARQMDWKTLLAYISGSVDEELLLRNEYLTTENRILRDQIKGRVQLTNAERQTLADIAKKLGKKTLQDVAQMALSQVLMSQ
jgi:putative transposase